MNEDNTSNMFYNCWILISGLFGALNLRAIVIDIRSRSKINEEMKAKDTKIIMLEAKVLYLETQLNDNIRNRDPK